LEEIQEDEGGDGRGRSGGGEKGGGGGRVLDGGGGEAGGLVTNSQKYSLYRFFTT